jgi:hypothetical protein
MKKKLVPLLLLLASTACLTIHTPPPVVTCCERCSDGGRRTPGDPDPDPIDPCPPCAYQMASRKHAGVLGDKATGLDYPIAAGELKLLWTDASGNVQSAVFPLNASTGTPGTDVTQVISEAPTAGVTKAWVRWKGSDGGWTDYFAKPVKE